MLEASVVEKRQYWDTAFKHCGDHCFAQYMVHFIRSHGVKSLPLLASSALQLLMQRDTTSTLHTSVYFIMQAPRSKLASKPTGQDSQSPTLMDFAGAILGPARLGWLLSGQRVKVSQPVQKSPGLHSMHSGSPRQDKYIFACP